MVQIMKTGQVVTRNSKHIKATPIMAKQFLRDQLHKSTTDPVDEILKHFEKQVKENVTINCNKQRKEGTIVNSDTQQSNMQEHIVNQIPANSKKEEI